MLTTLHRREILQAGPAEGLAGLLGVSTTSPGVVRPMWHCVHLLDMPPQADLGSDGHPAANTVPTPPRAGMRRMFAGGRVTCFTPLRIGVEAERRTEVTDVATKQGRSDELTFVTVRHTYSQASRIAVVDEQQLVYRAALATGSSVGPEPGPDRGDRTEVSVGPGEREVLIDATLLFRFSALTYNAHRVHYDRDFATQVEGHRGLLVHGPLQALLMAEAVYAPAPAPRWRFEYRLESPLVDRDGCVVGGVTGPGGVIETHVRDRFGRRTARGRFTGDASSGE